MSKKEKLRILHEVLGHSRKQNDEFLFKCPFCDHRKHKLSINVNKNVYKCWTCNTRGRSCRRIVRRFGTVPQLQVWDEVSDEIDLAAFADLFNTESDEPEILLDLPDDFVSLVSDKTPATGRMAMAYLQKRGLTKLDILKWKIGYCFSGEYEGRIIIPSFNGDGNLNYFIARKYNGNYHKYKNPKASKDIVFNELYIDWDLDLTIVEGVFDAINAGNAVPILGSTLSSNARLIQKIVLNDTPVYVALDADAAEKERKIIKTLLKYDVELYKIDVTGYEDVGSMPKEVFTERKSKAVFIDRDNYLLLDMLSAI